MTKRAFSYNRSTAEAAATRRNYQQGYVYGIISEAEVTESGDKEDLPGGGPHYQAVKFKFTPLRDPDDESSGTGGGINKWQGVGVEPDFWAEMAESGELPEEVLAEWRRVLSMYTRGCHQLATATGLGDIPDVPRWDGDEEGYMFRGEKLDLPEGLTPPERDEHLKPYRVEALEASDVFFAEQVLANPSMLNGLKCFGQVKYEKDKRTGGISQYPSVDNFRADTPMSKGKPVPVLYGDDIMQAPPATTANKVEAPAESAKKKAPAKKKAAGKK